MVGTDGYMSPEQANGYNIDTRTDIYSLGCLLHYMLTGTHAIPKQSNDYDTINAILENKFPLVADRGIVVSDKVQNAILKAVNKNMTFRFQTAEEFKFALSNKRIFLLDVQIVTLRFMVNTSAVVTWISFGNHKILTELPIR